MLAHRSVQSSNWIVCSKSTRQREIQLKLFIFPVQGVSFRLLAIKRTSKKVQLANFDLLPFRSFVSHAALRFVFNWFVFRTLRRIQIGKLGFGQHKFFSVAVRVHLICVSCFVSHVVARRLQSYMMQWPRINHVETAKHFFCSEWKQDFQFISQRRLMRILLRILVRSTHRSASCDRIQFNYLRWKTYEK